MGKERREEGGRTAKRGGTDFPYYSQTGGWAERHGINEKPNQRSFKTSIKRKVVDEKKGVLGKGCKRPMVSPP